MTAERKKIPKKSSHEGKYLSESSSKPINLFDLEEERQEAALIIEKVNKKAKDIKNQLDL